MPTAASKEGRSDSDEEDAKQLQFKVILLGNGSVGKTSLAVRFTQDHYGKSYKQTIGVDFFLKQLHLPGNTNVALQIWDIGGQTIGGRMLGNYIFGCQAILLVYDITNYQSFQDLEEWLGMARQACGSRGLPYTALVANKSDMMHLRSVKGDKHNAMVTEHNLYSYSLSAKTGENVAATFYRLAGDLAGIPLTDEQVAALLTVVAVPRPEAEGATGLALGDGMDQLASGSTKAPKRRGFLGIFGARAKDGASAAAASGPPSARQVSPYHVPGGDGWPTNGIGRFGKPTVPTTSSAAVGGGFGPGRPAGSPPSATARRGRASGGDNRSPTPPHSQSPEPLLGGRRRPPRAADGSRRAGARNGCCSIM